MRTPLVGVWLWDLLLHLTHAHLHTCTAHLAPTQAPSNVARLRIPLFRPHQKRPRLRKVGGRGMVLPGRPHEPEQPVHVVDGLQQRPLRPRRPRRGRG